MAQFHSVKPSWGLWASLWLPYVQVYSWGNLKLCFSLDRTLYVLCAWSALTSVPSVFRGGRHQGLRAWILLTLHAVFCLVCLCSLKLALF